METENTGSKPDLIIAGRSDGFGARIGNLLIAKRDSSQTNTPMETVWVQLPKKHGYNGDIQDILALESLENFHFVNNPKQLIQHTSQRRERHNCIRIKHCVPIYKDEAERDQARGEFISAFQTLRFTPKIQAAMDRVDAWAQQERQASAHLFGIHMRLGDVCQDVQRFFNNKYLPEGIYRLFIDKVALTAQNASFYLASNDPVARAELKAKLGNITVMGDIFDTADYNGIEIDFLEIYLLSRCAVIYGPKLSAFSQCASMISGSKIESIGEYTLGPEMIGIIDQLLKDCAKQVAAQTLALSQASEAVQAIRKKRAEGRLKRQAQAASSA